MASHLSPLRLALYAWLFSVIGSLPGFIQAGLVNGELCYALDDSFIMMALAKNLAFHQVWGMTPHAFSSTASSIGFTGLLALLFRLAGDALWMPLAINLVALFGLYYTTAAIGLRYGLNRWQTWILLMGLFFFMPVPVLLFGSMEHILHTWIAVGVLYRIVDPEKEPGLFVLFGLGLLLGSIRFEGLLEGGLLVLVLWQRKHFTKGVLFGLGLGLPSLVLGLVSLQKGWFFFPNSLILKAYGMNIQGTGKATTFFLSLLSKAANHPHAIAAVLALYLGLESLPEKTSARARIIQVVLGNSVLHFFLARYNHVFRYEAYLMALAWIPAWLLVCRELPLRRTTDLKAWVKQQPRMAGFAALLLLGPAWRSVDSYAVGTRAMCNIYQQQVQTGKFIARYYPNDAVAAIDIGAITYYSQCRLLDLWGLGTMEMARLKLQNRYTPMPIDSFCRNAGIRVAIVYGNKLRHPAWKTVERWVIPHNAVCSQDTIDFVAIFPQEEAILRKNLANFRPQLHPSVTTLAIP